VGSKLLYLSSERQSSESLCLSSERLSESLRLGSGRQSESLHVGSVWQSVACGGSPSIVLSLGCHISPPIGTAFVSLRQNRNPNLSKERNSNLLERDKKPKKRGKGAVRFPFVKRRALLSRA